MQLHLELVTFEYHRLKVRTFGTPDNPLFAAKDVCLALGLENVTRALESIDEDDITLSKVTDSIGRKQDIKCLTETGLYQLIFKSEKEEAKEFKRWMDLTACSVSRLTAALSASSRPMAAAGSTSASAWNTSRTRRQAGA